MRKLPIIICPLLAIAGIDSSGGPAVCIEGHCAWWNGIECAIVTAADSLKELSKDGINMRQT